MSNIPEKQKLAWVSSRKEVGKVVEGPVPKPGKNQVLVKVAYSPINPSDVGTIENWYPVQMRPPYGVGMEASGTIVALGDNLNVPHQIGDKVSAIGQGGWGQYMICISEQVYKIKEGTSMEQAACHFVNPATVIYMARLVAEGKHKAAVHTSGSSALGRILIRYFKEKGIKLINVVRREEYVKELLDAGADYALNSEAPDFDKKFREIAAKEKATICFDAIAGDFTGKIVRLMPHSSHIFVYGALSGKNVGDVSVNDLSFQDKVLTGLWTSKLMREAMKKKQTGALYEEIKNNLNTNFRSNIQKVFTLDELEQALVFYKANSSKGKVLIKPNL